MTSINLLKVASLPGSGSGCQSALPAEVGKAKERGQYSFPVCEVTGEPIPRWMGVSGFVVVEDAITKALAVLAEGCPPKWSQVCNFGGFDAAGGGE